MIDTADKFDWDKILEERGDEETMREVLAIFSDELTSLMTQIRQAIQADDASAFQRHAHTLKSNLAMFYFDTAASIAEVLEINGRQLEKLRKLGDVREKLTRNQFLGRFLDRVLQPHVDHTCGLVAAFLRGES